MRISPEFVMMVSDAIDHLGATLLWLAVVVLVAGVIVVIGSFLLTLAIRWTVRYLVRRMAEGRL